MLRIVGAVTLPISSSASTFTKIPQTLQPREGRRSSGVRTGRSPGCQKERPPKKACIVGWQTVRISGWKNHGHYTGTVTVRTMCIPARLLLKVTRHAVDSSRLGRRVG